MSYTLQLLHYYGEAGMLAVQTAPITAALVDKFDDQYANTLKVAEGDTWIPGPWLNGGADPSLNGVATIGSSTALGKPDVAILNALGTNVSALGNHEFDLGSPVVATALSIAKFAYVTDNLNFSADSSLKGIADSTLGGTSTNHFAGQEASSIKGKIAPYTVVTLGGEKIGIVGATTFELLIESSPNGTKPTGDLSNLSDAAMLPQVATVVQAAVDSLTAMGVNKIVMIDQLDTIARDAALAPLVHGIDIIVGGGGHERLGDSTDTAVGFNGHTGTFAGTYPQVTAGSDGAPTLIVTTDTEYTYLGRLVATFDNNGVLDTSSLDPAINGAYAATEANLQAAYGTTNSAAQIIAGSTMATTVKTIANDINTVVSAKDGNVFGYTNVYLEGDRAFGRVQETNLGDMATDGYIWKAAHDFGISGPIVGLDNGGGIRASIGSVDASGNKLKTAATDVKPAGGISQLDVENAFRFNNSMMIMDTTAQGLKNIFDTEVGNSPNLATQYGGFGQVGGIQFSFNPTAAAGHRILNMALVDAQGHVTARIMENGVVSPDAPSVIKLITNSFEANGGDGYVFKANASNFHYLLADGTLSATVDPSKAFGDIATVKFYGLTDAQLLHEQKIFEDYVSANFGTQATAYNQADSSVANDSRVQNLQYHAADTIFKGATLAGTIKADTLTGSLLNDTISGGTGHDSLLGGGGSDSLDGGVGNDTLVSGTGNSTLQGSTGHNTLDGGAGNDYLHAADGSNLLLGGAGNDRLATDAGSSTLMGGDGNDTLTARGNNTLDGGAGNDNLLADDGNSLLMGGAGNDTLRSNSGNNTLDGGTGRDLLIGGPGADDFVLHFGTATKATVTGFTSLSDYLQISASEFGGGLVAGEDMTSHFLVGIRGAQAQTRFVYDQAHGNLFFDADGSGIGAKVLVATFTDHAAITASDLHIIA